MAGIDSELGETCGLPLGRYVERAVGERRMAQKLEARGVHVQMSVFTVG